MSVRQPRKSPLPSPERGKMGKMTSEETVTEATRTDKIELSRFGEFCQRHGINPNLIMLKITLFVMYGGEYNRQSPAPFYTPSFSLPFSVILSHLSLKTN